MFWQSPGMALFDDCSKCLQSSPRGIHVCAKQAQQILRNDCADQQTVPPPIEGAVGFGTRKLHKPRLSTRETPSLSQSHSSETPATSLSASTTSPVSEEAREKKTRRKWRERRPFNLFPWTSLDQNVTRLSGP